MLNVRKPKVLRTGVPCTIKVLLAQTAVPEIFCITRIVSRKWVCPNYVLYHTYVYENIRFHSGHFLQKQTYIFESVLQAFEQLVIQRTLNLYTCPRQTHDFRQISVLF